MSLKSFVGRISLRRRLKQMNPAALEFPGALTRTRQVLVCLPGGLRELTVVKQFLPTIKEIFKPAVITLLPMPGVRVNDIYPRKGFNILSPTPDQVTWVGLPKRTYVKSLQECEFDILLDLNFEQSMFTSGILLSFPDAVRVGRGSFLGKPYYNLEIRTRYLRDERNICRSLLQTLEKIRSAAVAQPEGGSNGQ
ncbi:MAG: hypothetical protein KAW91_04465 [candidate division Zixibacteria bacterium]|nr:hypothetical protein [candidate division Zixibacteria bacterium]MCK4605686.1 hypothetical protein [candidate division Zixibacteria bacterium]